MCTIYDDETSVEVSRSDQGDIVEVTMLTTTTAQRSPLSPPIGTAGLSPSSGDGKVAAGKGGRSKIRRRMGSRSLPKNTVPVKCVGKSKLASDFSPLLLTMTLTKIHDGPIWCTAFNKDGTYFATGGMDGVLQIWDVSPPSPHDDTTTTTTHPDPDDTDSICDATTHFSETTSDTDAESTAPHTHHGTPAQGTEIRILSSTPRQRFTDHTQDIVDVSWSHTDFLLSASLDKTVRLWHPTRPTCLRLFRHADLVPAVSFHPNDDRYFLSGSFDRKVRIWSIKDGRVKDWVQTPHIISAAEYQPDGESIAVGLFDGKVIFYTVDGGIKLKYRTQINCKNKKSAVGEKVTGLTFVRKLSEGKEEESCRRRQEGEGDGPKKIIGLGQFMKEPSSVALLVNQKKQRAYQLLVTTNDSRVRLVGLNDFRVVRKYKGVFNSSLQIESHISESGRVERTHHNVGTMVVSTIPIISSAFTSRSPLTTLPTHPHPTPNR